MTKYVQTMARMFNGFRLDNAHSTPIFIAEYLAQKAREVNPDLIIMAELFTKKEKEVHFVNRIGINLLIRELIWCNDARSLSEQIHKEERKSTGTVLLYRARKKFTGYL